jgi:hypothetical protein
MLALQLGDTWSDLTTILAKAPDLLAKVSTILNKGEKYLDTAMQVVEDPALPQVVDLVKQLKAIEAAKAKKAGTTPSAATTKSIGIGLEHAIMPLKMYVAYRTRPWFGYVAIAGVLAIPLAVGVLAGRVSKRSGTTKASTSDPR